MEKKKKTTETNRPIIAPGMNTDEALDEEATEANIEKGEYTKVTKLVYDEYDPSGER